MQPSCSTSIACSSSVSPITGDVKANSVATLYHNIRAIEPKIIVLDDNAKTFAEEQLAKILEPKKIEIKQENDVIIQCECSFVELIEFAKNKFQELARKELKLNPFFKEKLLNIFLYTHQSFFLIDYETVKEKLKEKEVDIDGICDPSFSEDIKEKFGSKPRYITIHFALNFSSKGLLTLFEDIFLRNLGKKIAIPDQKSREKIVNALAAKQDCEYQYWLKDSRLDTEGLRFCAAQDLLLTKHKNAKGELRFVIKTIEGNTVEFVFSKQIPKQRRIHDLKIPFDLSAQMKPEIEDLRLFLPHLASKICKIDFSSRINYQETIETFKAEKKDFRAFLINMSRGNHCQPQLLKKIVDSFIGLVESDATLRSSNVGNLIAAQLEKALEQMIAEDPKGEKNRPYAALVLTLNACELLQQLRREELQGIISNMSVHWQALLKNPDDTSIFSLIAKSLKLNFSYRTLSAMLRLASFKEFYSQHSTALTVSRGLKGRIKGDKLRGSLQIELRSPAGTTFTLPVSDGIFPYIKEMFFSYVDSDEQEAAVENLFAQIYKEKVSFVEIWSKAVFPGMETSFEPILRFVKSQFDRHPNKEHTAKCLQLFCQFALAFLPAQAQERMSLMYLANAATGEHDDIGKLYSILGSSKTLTLNEPIFKIFEEYPHPNLATALCHGYLPHALFAIKKVFKECSHEMRITMLDGIAGTLKEASREEAFHYIQELAGLFEDVKRVASMKNAEWLAEFCIDIGEFKLAKFVIPFIQNKDSRKKIQGDAEQEKIGMFLSYAGIKRSQCPAKEICSHEGYLFIAAKILKRNSKEQFAHIVKLLQLDETVSFFQDNSEDWWSHVLFPLIARLPRASSFDRQLLGLCLLGCFKVSPPKEKYREFYCALKLIYSGIENSGLSSNLTAGLNDNLGYLLSHLGKDVIEAALFFHDLGIPIPKEALPAILGEMRVGEREEMERCLQVIGQHPDAYLYKKDLEILYTRQIESSLSTNRKKAHLLLKELIKIAEPSDELIVQCLETKDKDLFVFLSNNVSLNRVSASWQEAFIALSQENSLVLELVNTKAFSEIGTSEKEAIRIAEQAKKHCLESDTFFGIYLKILPRLGSRPDLVKSFFEKLLLAHSLFLKEKCWRLLKTMKLSDNRQLINCWHLLFEGLRGTGSAIFQEALSHPEQFPLFDLGNKNRMLAIEILFKELARNKIEDKIFAKLKQFLEKEPNVSLIVRITYTKLLLNRKEDTKYSTLLHCLKSWFSENSDWSLAVTNLVDQAFKDISRKKPEIAEKELLAFIPMLTAHPHPVLGLKLVHALRHSIEADKLKLLKVLQATIGSALTGHNRRLQRDFYNVFRKLSLGNFFFECGDTNNSENLIQSLLYLNDPHVKKMYSPKWVSAQWEKLYPIFFKYINESLTLPTTSWGLIVAALTFLKNKDKKGEYFKIACGFLLKFIIAMDFKNEEVKESKKTIERSRAIGNAAVGRLEEAGVHSLFLDQVVPLWQEIPISDKNEQVTYFFKAPFFDLVYLSLEKALNHASDSLQKFIENMFEYLKLGLSHQPNMDQEKFVFCVAACTFVMIKKDLPTADFFMNTLCSNKVKKKYPDLILTLQMLKELKDHYDEKTDTCPQTLKMIASGEPVIGLVAKIIEKMPEHLGLDIAATFIQLLTGCADINSSTAPDLNFVSIMTYLRVWTNKLHEMKGALYGAQLYQLMSTFLRIFENSLATLQRDPSHGQWFITMLQGKKQRQNIRGKGSAPLALMNAINAQQIAETKMQGLKNAFIKENLAEFFANIEKISDSQTQMYNLVEALNLVLLGFKKTNLTFQEVERYLERFFSYFELHLMECTHINDALTATLRSFLKIICNNQFVKGPEYATKLIAILQKIGKQKPKALEFAEKFLAAAAQKGIDVPKSQKAITNAPSTSGSTNQPSTSGSIVAATSKKKKKKRKMKV